MESKLSVIEKQTMQNEQVVALVEEEPYLFLQKLVREEADLLEEKEKLHARLASLRKKRKLEVQRNIRRKEKSIQKLRAEIKDLKVSCEELSKALEYTGDAVSVKKRSKEEFEAYLRDALDFDYPIVKFQSPDAWRQEPTRRDA
ncbi:MAG: hypothetical protein PVH73_09680 [Candidatus Bathyarchaeota archaeon]|jgi:hypothetical protein